MNLGLCNLAIQNLFFQMFQRQEDFTYTVRVSYLEIYNEQVRDLLADLNQYAGAQRAGQTRLKDYISQLREDNFDLRKNSEQGLLEQQKAFNNHNSKK